MIYIYKEDDLEVFFQLDLTDGEDKSRSWKWPSRPVEAGASKSHYGVSDPGKYQVSGILSPLRPRDQMRDRSRVREALDALEEAADGQTVFELVGSYWSVSKVVLLELNAKRPKDADRLDVTLTFQKYDEVLRQETTIPASRLKRKKRGSGVTMAGNVKVFAPIGFPMQTVKNQYWGG